MRGPDDQLGNNRKLVADDQPASEVCIMRSGVMIVTLPDDPRTTDSRYNVRDQIARVSILEIPAIECRINDGSFSAGTCSAIRSCRGRRYLVLCWDSSRRVVHVRPIRLQRVYLPFYGIIVLVGNSQMIDL
jgi:hypothetical protein